MTQAPTIYAAPGEDELIEVPFSAWPSYAADWARLAAQHATPTALLADVTATYEWCDALVRSRGASADAKLFVLRRGAAIRALLPLLTKSRDSVLGAHHITAVTDLYCGRVTLLAEPAATDARTEILKRVLAGGIHWDTFTTTLSEHPSISALLERLGAECGVTFAVIERHESPLFALRASWGEQLAALPKKFRWTLRKSQADLEAQGTLRHVHFHDVSDVDAFFDCALEIERNSWKEEAGTSITANEWQERFYRTFLPIAAQRGWFSGHVLFLNDKPLAYILGLTYQGVFHDLKESYVSTFREHSPGHVLKAFALDQLCAAGVKIYDFMGACEPYKMKWTKSTYARTTYVVYNSTLHGRLAAARRLVRRAQRAASTALESRLRPWRSRRSLAR